MQYSFGPEGDPHIQAAFDQLSPIQIDKRRVRLTAGQDKKADIIAWLHESLTDNVHTLYLDLIYCNIDFSLLYELAQSKKNLEIIAAVDEYSAWATITFKKIKSRTIMSSCYYNPADSDLFDYWVPEGISDILTNHGAFNIPTEHLFGAITFEQESPKAPITITGISFDNWIEDINEQYFEFVSKLPTLKYFSCTWELGDKIKMLTENIRLNASALQHVKIIGDYSDPLVAVINAVLSDCKALTTLEIRSDVRPTSAICVTDLRALALNRTINELNIECICRHIARFIEPLRRNQKISKLSISLFVPDVASLPLAQKLMDMLAAKTCLRRLAIAIQFTQNCECSEDASDALLLAVLRNTNLTHVTLGGASFNDEHKHVTQMRRSRSCSRERCGRVQSRSRSGSNDDSNRSRSRSRSPDGDENRSRSTSRSRSRGRSGQTPSDTSDGRAKLLGLLLANPHLTSVEVTRGDIPQVLQAHIDDNRRKRDEARTGMVTVMYNIARSTFDGTGPCFLPELWCQILSHFDYPGFDQPCDSILQELFKNNAIRRVIKD